jgi:hypothetical protein
MPAVALVTNKVLAVLLFCVNFLCLSFPNNPSLPRLPKSQFQKVFKGVAGWAGEIILKDQYTSTNGGELTRIQTNERINRRVSNWILRKREWIMGAQISQICQCGICD